MSEQHGSGSRIQATQDADGSVRVGDIRTPAPRLAMDGQASSWQSAIAHGQSAIARGQSAIARGVVCFVLLFLSGVPHRDGRAGRAGGVARGVGRRK